MRTLLPPTFLNGALVIAILAHLVVPLYVFLQFPLTLWGFVPIAFGAYMNLHADRLLKLGQTTVKPFERPSALVSTGPYAWCRHPMYLGMVSILAGVAILCGSLGSLAGVLLFWIAVRVRFIPEEERSMKETFGDAYREYRRRVRSWV